jgi:hypothetical protein
MSFTPRSAAALYGLRQDMEPNEDERMYIKHFAAEVADPLAAHSMEPI